MAGVCQEAEGLGATALWAVDHLFWGRPLLECTTVATVAATATRRAVVGTCVLQLPLRAAAAVAKQATTLQLLTGGRFVLGVGAGSHAGEYEMAGADFAGRGRQLDEGIAALRSAWRSAEVPTAPYRQEPTGAAVPVWVGGSSPAARRRAAAMGDGWVPLFLPPPQLADALERLREETAAAGRDPGAVAPAAVVMVATGDDPGVRRRGTHWLSSLYGIPPKAFERHLVAGPAAHCAEELARYREAGAEHVVVMVADDDALGHFARIVDALPGATSDAVPVGPSALARTAFRPSPEPMEVPA